MPPQLLGSVLGSRCLISFGQLLRSDGAQMKPGEIYSLIVYLTVLSTILFYFWVLQNNSETRKTLQTSTYSLIRPTQHIWPSFNSLTCVCSTRSTTQPKSVCSSTVHCCHYGISAHGESWLLSASCQLSFLALPPLALLL